MIPTRSGVRFRPRRMTIRTEGRAATRARPWRRSAGRLGRVSLTDRSGFLLGIVLAAVAGLALLFILLGLT